MVKQLDYANKSKREETKMKNKANLLGFIADHINNKLCKKKLEISYIRLFKKGDLHESFPDKEGWYLSDKKEILIKKNASLIMQIIILCHELAHAYQWQILGKKGKDMHDIYGGKIYQKFIKETDKILEIKLK